jgi:hypothetical protein
MLTRWVRTIYMSGGRKPERFELRHVNGAHESREHRVDSWNASQFGKRWDLLIEVIHERAQEDATHYRGPQRYAVVVYRENGDGSYDARTFLRYQAGNLIESEPPKFANEICSCCRPRLCLAKSDANFTGSVRPFGLAYLCERPKGHAGKHGAFKVQGANDGPAHDVPGQGIDDRTDKKRLIEWGVA